MIARTWTGVTPASKADAYQRYLRRTGVRACRATPGNRGVLLLRRTDGGRTRFLFLSLWDDRAAVERFAGPHADRAVYFPDDWAYLAQGDDRVEHHDVAHVEVPGPEPPWPVRGVRGLA